MGLKQMIANKNKSCAVALPSTRNAQLLDDLDKNTRNQQRNTNATTNTEALIDKYSIRNLPRNHDATVQKTDAQLLPLKTPQKLHTKNEELHVKTTENTPLGGGDNSVIIANSTNTQAANDPHCKGEIKPVIQETVRQVLTAQIEPLKKDSSTTDLSHQLANQVKQGGGVQPPMEDGHLSHKTKVQPTPQIEESSRPEVLGAVKPEPQKNGAAPKFYGDDIFPKNEEISPPIGHGQSHTTDEVLANHERPLFYHLLACPYCHIEKAQYCVSGYAMGSVYEALLLNRDDAQVRRESLALRVDRACISGRGVFVPFSRSDAPPPPNTELQTRKYGNTLAYETFINHWTACDVCRPNLNRYCSEGQELEKDANQ